MKTGMTARLSKGEARLLWKRAEARGIGCTDGYEPKSDNGRLMIRKPHDNARYRMVWVGDSIPESVCMEWCRRFGYPVARLKAEDFL